MHVYHNMNQDDFIAHLRDIAIKDGARPAIIYQLDALADIPSEQDIEQREHVAGETGFNDGRSNQWEICFDMLDDKLNDDAIGLTETQVNQIRQLMLAIKPE